MALYSLDIAREQKVSIVSNEEYQNMYLSSILESNVILRSNTGIVQWLIIVKKRRFENVPTLRIMLKCWLVILAIVCFKPNIVGKTARGIPHLTT